MNNLDTRKIERIFIEKLINEMIKVLGTEKAESITEQAYFKVENDINRSINIAN